MEPPSITQWSKRSDPGTPWWPSSAGSTSLSSTSTSSSLQGGGQPSPSNPWSSSSSGGAGSVPPSSVASSPISSMPLSSSGQSFTTTSTNVFMTSYPVTITRSSTTFTSYSTTVVTSLAASSTPSPQSDLRVAPVCLGHGLDAWSSGLISTVVLFSGVGLFLWLLFAVLRPRFRQVYGLREWFPQHELRPRPSGSSFFAFLAPHVPLVPAIPTDVSGAGRSAATDAKLFPSDEELSQRTIWIGFLLCLVWSVLGLGGALPLYIVSTPCLAKSADQGAVTGAYSIIQDLSLLRLLQSFENRTSSTPANFVSLSSRALFNGEGVNSKARIRTIVLTVLVVVFGVLLALWFILREFSLLVAYRRRWVEVRCEEKEMGWLSATKAPGFVGWGEQRLKDYLLKTGLSSTLDLSGENKNGRKTRRHQQNGGPFEEQELEIDIQTLFSVGDTEQLAYLIDERDEILENLEIAETRYITSFKKSTPDPSIADLELPIPETIPEHPAEDNGKPLISRPRPLNGTARQPFTTRPRRRRTRNPAFASSSLPPTSYLMPSSYYKLRGVQGINEDDLADLEDFQPRTRQRDVSFTDTINQRIIGSRFQEVNRNSVAFGRLPLGSRIQVGEYGQLGPTPPTRPRVPSTISDLMRYGPNHSSWAPFSEQQTSAYDSFFQRSHGMSRVSSDLGGEWVDLLHEPPQTFEDEPDHYESHAVEQEIGEDQRRPPQDTDSLSDHRETFPLRLRNLDAQSTDPIPPHLRLQPQQPFVRPLSGIDHQNLGAVYADISHWRTRLKAINAEIADAQSDCYNDIADGARIKGWLMVGKGLRYLPGIELIEGRSKEDIKWGELQRQGGIWNAITMWTMVTMVFVLLAAVLTAVAGLTLSTSPDVARYLTFLGPLGNNKDFVTGIATVLCPTLAAMLFITVSVVAIHLFTQFDGYVSVSGSRLVTFKTIFFVLTIVAGIWLMVIGAVLFSVETFQLHEDGAKSVADGFVIMTAFALALIISVAIISPALLILQPFRLWKVIRAEKQAVTPRQQFRAIYPHTYDPSYALACFILGIIFASAFGLIFPLIAPAVTLLLFLTLISHRYLIGYVYGRTLSSTGGLFQIWLLRRFATLLAFQPLILGLIFATRHLWEEAGVLLATSVIVVIYVEIFCWWKTRQRDAKSLSNVTQDSLQAYASTARPMQRLTIDEESISLVSSAVSRRVRGSMASVFEMMSMTLAVAPSPSDIRGPVPIQTETLDDLTATERAARSHPDAPPHIPALSFTDHAGDMAGILYAPELIAPPPIIWLPHDVAGIAESEALDLQQYHALQVTIDVKDVIPVRRSSFLRMRRTSQ